MSETALAVINPAALKHNFNLLKTAAAGCKVMPALKADAYGHGMLAVARLLPEADAFALARVSEGVQLRQAGIEQPLVILGGCIDKDELALAFEHELELVIHHAVQFDLLDAWQGGGQLKVWIKLDTGMGRLGFDPAELPQVQQRLQSCSAVVPKLRIMSHLACADDPANDMTIQQLERFAHCLGNDFSGDVSLANSAGILQWPDTLRSGDILSYRGDNWVRPGLALYGVSPVNGKSAKDLGLQPVMSFYSRLIAVKSVPAGSSVGYGADWVAEQDTTIGIAAIGYGDGYPRHVGEGTPVLVNGRVAELVGRVSMDLIAINLNHHKDTQPGDTVELWGETLEVQTIAESAGTIAYELLTQLSPRTRRELKA